MLIELFQIQLYLHKKFPPKMKTAINLSQDYPLLLHIILFPFFVFIIMMILIILVKILAYSLLPTFHLKHTYMSLKLQSNTR